MRWFKFYGQDWLTDLKIRRLRTEDKICFITLMCLASTADEKGLVRNCTEEDLISLSNLYQDPYNDNNEYTRALGCLERYAALQIVTLHDNGDVTINAFDARQSENTTAAERQKKYRERLKTTTKKRDKRDVTRYNDSNARIEENRIEENRITKEKFGEFGNVFLTTEEHAKLVEQLNQNAVDTLIAELDGYIASTGKKYKNHYATLQNWARRRIEKHVTEIKSKKSTVAF